MIDIAIPPYQAHNLKVVGSNPTPATNNINDLAVPAGAAFCVWSQKSRNHLSPLFSRKEPDGRFVLVCVTKKYYKSTHKDATRTQERDDGT